MTRTPSGRVFDVSRGRVEDGPGLRTVVFLKGCSARCPWCHNPEGIGCEIEVVTVQERCIGCRECVDGCPEQALREVEHEVGVVERGRADGIDVVKGTLAVGKPSPVPVVRAAKAVAPDEGITILDAPPGTTCPTAEAVRGSDLVILVTEPTPFGLHDLDLAVRMTRALALATRMIVNRCDVGGSPSRRASAS